MARGGALRVGNVVRIKGNYRRYDVLLSEVRNGKWYSLITPVNGNKKFWVPQSKLIKMKYRY
ncbi:MAG: hypothetical protein ACOCRX_08380 [Candidatus Woesearchaeota archaeon]